MGCTQCEIATSKCILIFLNTIFLASGLFLLGAGIWFLVDPYILYYLNIADLGGSGNLATNIAYATLAIGGVMFIVSFFGCFGACCGNHCMLYSYATLMVLVICGQIALGVLALVNKSFVNDTLEESMQIFVQQEYLGAEETAISKSWDYLQIDLECCGAVNRDDYNSSRWLEEKAEPGWYWPRTCCVLSNEDPLDPELVDEAGCKAGNATAMHTQGCYEPLGEWIDVWGAAIAGCLIAFAFLQMGMVGLACCLVNNLKTYPVDNYTV